MRHLSLRNRLTLLYSGAMLLAGGVLLTLNWLSVRQAIGSRAAILKPPVDTAPTVVSPAATAPVPATHFDTFESAVLGDLLLRSGIALVLMTACAAFLGRRLAGRWIDRLEKAYAAQRVFTAQASHELRTPLTLQRTALEVPLAQGRVPAHLQPALRQALAATSRSEELIASLLALAKGESGTLHPTRTDLCHLVAAALTDVSPEIQALSLQVRTELGPAPVEGDAPLLAQLVSNVVTNAVRHNVPHGELHIASRHDRVEGRSQLIVSNTGTVLDQATTADLFMPFRRGTPRSGGPRGSGLGLSVVKAVAEAHRGSVDARCRKGGGLEIRVRLPDRLTSA
ncbi:sensor histidine kinase [Streptomyces silvisoli]|uniref:histidine kinase n=1 Tax=Streptomyces silvisoli TaxID=3034235 RepID=A0ABT5ZW16_9ACTN|nr:HAMP domain-containing sensor histidine kinase [Streptomyces silvisoli]MDF3293228.1 HAMP domain-containing sensor histidine kinase [Streptomyces silvisoli]